MTPEPNILIVDDDLTAIQTLHKALRGMGKIRFASGGREALDLLADYPGDLVLLDANMPEMDGFATCLAIRQDFPELPVIFVTASTDFATEVHALECGARDFITKPIHPPVVRARIGVHLQLKALYDRLYELSGQDPLTGLANRRVLDERVALEWRRASRHDQPLSLIMIDIDHFKSYNDHYGHLQGDECLRQVAQTLAETVSRTADLVARYGGEEFAILLPGSDITGALALADKIRTVIGQQAIPHAYSDAAPCVTLSLGVASVRPTMSRRDRDAPAAPPATPGESGLALARALFDQADRALYRAKAAGRNRVAVD